MTKQEAIEAMKSGQKVTHRFWTNNKPILGSGPFVYENGEICFTEGEVLRTGGGMPMENQWELFNPTN